MTGSRDSAPSLLRYSLSEIVASPVSAEPSDPKTNCAPCLLNSSNALKTSLSFRKNRVPGSQYRTRNAKMNCRRMPQMTTLQGKLLRSSDITQATIVKMMIPEAEIKFCMRGSEPQYTGLWEDLQ